MGRVWYMIFISASFVFGASMLWYWSDLHAIKIQNQKENTKTAMSIATLSAYRDILKEKGKDAAKTYLEQLQKNPYGI